MIFALLMVWSGKQSSRKIKQKQNIAQNHKFSDDKRQTTTKINNLDPTTNEKKNRQKFITIA